MPCEDLEFLRTRAFTALDEGRFDDAKRLFSIVLQAEPEDCDSRAGLMESYIRLGEVEEAKRMKEKECISPYFLLVMSMISPEDEQVRMVISALASMKTSPSLHVKNLAMELIESIADRAPVDVLKSVSETKCDIAIEAIRKVLNRFEASDRLDILGTALHDVNSSIVRDVIEDKYEEYLRSERFTIALRYVDNFDFLDRDRLMASVLEAADNAREYGHLDEAISLYGLLMEIDTSDSMRKRIAGILLQLAKALIRRGDHTRALSLLRQVMELGRSGVRDEFDEIGHALVKEGKYADALTVFEEMSDIFDNFNMAYHVKNIANFLKDDGEYEEAVRYYRIVQKYDPHFDIREQYVHIGDALLSQGRYREALDYFKMGGERPSSFIGRAICLERMGREGDASRILSAARRRWPDDLKVLREWCEFLERRGRLGVCLRSVEKALELDPRARWALDMFCRVAQQLIRQAELERSFFDAFLLYQRYLRRFPDDEWAMERRDLCLTVLKGRDRKAWKRAVSMLPSQDTEIHKRR